MFNTLLKEIRDIFTIDYRSLSLFRVFLGLILIADLYLRLPSAQLFLTDYGVVPRESLKEGALFTFKSVYLLSGELWFVYILLGLNAIAALALVLGFKTRWAVFICFILVVSLQLRSPPILSLADTLIKVLLFWAMFLPINRHFSFDQAVSKSIDIDQRKGHFSIATFAIIMQVLYVYWVGALLKTGDPWITDLSAVKLALSLEHFSYDLGGAVLANFDWALSWVTGFVYTIELFGPLLILAPIVFRTLRLPIVFLLMMMHVGFAVLMNVGIFPFVSICSLIVLLNTPFWDKIDQFMNNKKGRGITIYYDGSCDFCLKTVMILKQFFILPSAKVEIAQNNLEANKLFLKHDSWVVQTPEGERFIEWSAMVELVKQSSLKFVFILPIILLKYSGLGNKFYHAIGNRRKGLGKITRLALPWREKRFDYDTTLLKSFVGLMFLCVFIVNLVSVNKIKKVIPLQGSIAFDMTMNMVSLFNLQQKWRMFAPSPVNVTQWPVVEGLTEKGDKIDLFRNRLGEASKAKPKRILNEFDYYRKRKYFENLYASEHLRKYYLKHLCQSGNQKGNNTQLNEIVMGVGEKSNKFLDRKIRYFELSEMKCEP